MVKKKNIQKLSFYYYSNLTIPFHRLQKLDTMDI